jgi:NADH dehydrogenase FAD-containing subunit
MIEKNSHFHYLFAFPRFSVVSGYENQAFIPIDSIFRNAPKGIFRRVHDEVVKIKDDVVILASGDVIPYAYLVMATVTSQPQPAKLLATGKAEACQELKSSQTAIHKAASIAVVGGGAVGIEIVTDIKSKYPEKDVTWIHSRKKLLSQFGPELQDHVLKVTEKQQIKVILGERPQVLNDGELRFSDGQVQRYDHIVSKKCG